MKNSRLQMWVGFSGALAVALGALGAHYLKSQVQLGRMTIDNLNGFETGSRYHLLHTLVLFAVLLLRKETDNYKTTIRLFTWGIILFSGSLYLLCTRELWEADGLRLLGPVTPIGGILLIAGWLSLAFTAWKKNQKY